MTRQNPTLNAYEIIIQGCRILGIPLQNEAVKKMIRHMELVRTWGAKINLTAVKEPQDMAVLHFLDSMTVLKVIPRGQGMRLLDIGTGAGFPGLVLSTADETLSVTLLDRDPKKIVFLKHVALELPLKRIAFLNMALRNLLHEGTINRFDLVVSRGFSSNAAVMDGLHILLNTGGSLIMMTGPSFSEKFTLKNFRLAQSWEGILPFSKKFRRVSRYQRTAE